MNEEHNNITLDEIKEDLKEIKRDVYGLSSLFICLIIVTFLCVITIHTEPIIVLCMVILFLLFSYATYNQYSMINVVICGIIEEIRKSKNIKEQE